MLETALLDHYGQYLPSPRRLVAGGDDVRVFAWPDLDTPGSAILTTVGMSSLPQIVPTGQSCLSPEPRTELFMLISAQGLIPSLAQVLHDLAGYPRQHSTFLHWFHALPLGQPLLPGSPLSAFYFTIPPVSAPFATLSTSASRIDILWAVPISEAERLHFASHGPDSLEELFEGANLDLSDPFRPCVA